MCLTRAEQRERIASFDLLATPCLIQLRRLLAFSTARTHCWIMSHLLLTRSLSSFSTKLLSSESASSFYWFVGLFLLRCRTSHFSLLNFISRFLWPVEDHLKGSTALPCLSHTSWFCANCRLGEDALCPVIQVTSEDVKQYWPSINPWGTAFGVGFQSLHAADHNSLSSVPPVFSLLCVILSSPYFISFSIRMLSETALKALLKSR